MSSNYWPDRLVGGLGEGFVGIVGDDQTPEAAGEAKVIRGPVFLLQLRDIAIVHVAVGLRYGKTIAKADGAAQRCRREAAEPNRRMRFWIGSGVTFMF